MIMLRVDKREAEILRAALFAHNERVEIASRKAKRDKDLDHHTRLVAESKSAWQMIRTLDAIIRGATE